MVNLKKLQALVLKNKVEKGFNTTNIPLEFCLLHEEVSEAFHAYIKKHPNIGEELADVAIYLLGLSEMLEIDLEKEIRTKIAINHHRVYTRVNGVLEKKTN